MDITQVIKQRRSIRNFSNKSVEKEKIEKLIELAASAPSACNLQGWKFLIVDDENQKNKLVDYGGSKKIKTAPLGILVIYDNRTKNYEFRDDIQSAAAAIENLLLAIVNEGLGGCWICHLPAQKTIRKIFKIPNNYSAVAYILLGYPEKAPQEIPRKNDMSQIMNYNNFSDNWPREKTNYLKTLIKRSALTIYFHLPVLIKKSFLNKFLDKYFVKKFDN